MDHPVLSTPFSSLPPPFSLLSSLLLCFPKVCRLLVSDSWFLGLGQDWFQQQFGLAADMVLVSPDHPRQTGSLPPPAPTPTPFPQFPLPLPHTMPTYPLPSPSPCPPQKAPTPFPADRQTDRLDSVAEQWWAGRFPPPPPSLAHACVGVYPSLPISPTTHPTHPQAPDSGSPCHFPCPHNSPTYLPTPFLVSHSPALTPICLPTPKTTLPLTFPTPYSLEDRTGLGHCFPFLPTHILGRCLHGMDGWQGRRLVSGQTDVLNLAPCLPYHHLGGHFPPFVHFCVCLPTFTPPSCIPLIALITPADRF